MSKNIDWNEVSESNILILKENETIQVKFLDNGKQESTDITDNNTGLTKEINKYVFKIIDIADGKPKEFSTLANRLMVQLKAFKPLKDKSLNINKFRFGSDIFDVDFKISEIK